MKLIEKMDLVQKIVDYEEGRMSEEEVTALFQELVDAGVAWSLQGSYGRMAQALIDAGLVKVKWCYLTTYPSREF